MKTLNFYHQKRKDGGLRTGVEFNGDRVLELFKTGRMRMDSALEWFVDLRCRGQNLPADPDEIRRWLIDHSHEIGARLESLADELRVGMDPAWPLTANVPSTPKGISITIVCSAVRRLTGREIGKILLDLKKKWPRLIALLPAVGMERAA